MDEFNSIAVSEVPIIATLRIEANLGSGEIITPDLGATLLNNQDGEATVLEEGVALYDKMLLRVGRARNNDLILDIPNVSRFHTVFTTSQNGIVLSDLSSKNGTFVNGKRIVTPVSLMDGDMIDIGPARIRINLNYGDPLESDTRLQATQVDHMEQGIVTVFVADIRNYTTLSEALPAVDIAEMLNIWFDRATEIIQHYGGEVDKYIGDCVMAIWHNTDEEEAAEMACNAVRAAQEIREVTDKLSKSHHWVHRDRYPWQCRVTVSTGNALIGSVSARGIRDFSVLGDAVNVAFRLDKVGSQLGKDFVFSEETAKYIKNKYNLEDLGKVEVKGKVEKVGVFTLKTPNSDSTGARL